MPTYAEHQPTITVHKNVFKVAKTADQPARKFREPANNTQINYAKGRIVRIDGFVLRIVDDGDTNWLADKKAETTWRCEYA